MGSEMLALALTLILSTVAYHLVMTLVDVYPLNNVRDAKRAEQWTEVAVNAPVMALPAVLLSLAAALDVKTLGYVAGGLELLIVAGGLLLWWLPYLAGVTVPWATAGTGVTWAQLHARTYAHTLVVLPRIGDRPRPNLEHMVLHALMLAAAVATFAAAG
ncbi:hypothetical protein AB0J82_15705 [Asanoa sp. NPDC049518]|uniref:hypothetical protein n=1 Tax=unclassified Asanoa TaxID=2685164 RepID=UPI0034411814